MTIDTVYTLTEEEYLEAQSLYIREKHKIIPYIRWGFVVIPILLVAVVVFNSSKMGQIFPPVTLIGSLVPVLIFGAVLPLSQKRALQKRFVIEKPNMTNVHLHMDEDGMRANVPGVGEGSIQWPAFSLWLEGNRLFILINAFMFRPIPKSALAQDEIDVLRQFLQAHVPTSKRPARR